MTRVSVVAPCRNEATTIDRLLGALAAQTAPPDEVIIVDDGSTDDTAARAMAWADRLPVRVVPGPCRGVAAALNTGIAAASGALIARCDGHSWPDPGYLAAAREAIDADPAIGIVGGVWRIVPGDQTAEAAAIAGVVSHPIGSGGAAYRHRPPASPQEVDTVPFGVFTRARWAALGGYDERLGANEDYDFNERVRRDGGRVVLHPALRSTYCARSTLSALARQYSRYGYWKRQMVRRDPTSVRLRQRVASSVVPVLTGGLLGAALGWPLASVVPIGYGLIVLIAAVQVATRAQRAALLLPDMAAILIVHNRWSGGWWVGTVTRPRA